MILYAESSAVLAWIFGEAQGEEASALMANADFIVCSDLTLVECDRAIHRAQGLDELSPERGDGLRDTLAKAARYWVVLRSRDDIVERARGPFPGSPIRSLDALHLSFALYLRRLVPDMALMTLDHRVQECGEALGFRVVPEAAA